MKDARAYLGAGIVGVTVILSALLAERGAALFTGFVGTMANGLLAATATFALVAYVRGRDPSLLLLGSGAAAWIGHLAVISVIIAILGTPVGERWLAVLAFAPITGNLALIGGLLVIVPWTDRRGRPPIDPRRVAAALAIGVLVLDVLVALTRPTVVAVRGDDGTPVAALVWLASAALVAGGMIVAIRSLSRGGRVAWVAAAGIATAIIGLTIPLGSLVQGRGAIRVLITWQSVGPALTAAMLVVFVLVSLHLEDSKTRRMTDRATEVMEGRAEIASSIAHDVRGPVGTIKGLATTTRKSYDRLGDPERLEFIGMIEEESGRLLRLVDQVALALKVDAGTLDPHLRVQSLAPLLRQAVEQTEASEHRIEVNADPRIEAAVDTRWFIEAVRQGLDNACGFSPAGEPVILTAIEGDDDVRISVVDHGPGIPADLRESLFEKFSRWRPAGYEDRQGSALGLFICRGIARLHGGEATLEDAPSGGTMLRIRLPREGNGE